MSLPLKGNSNAPATREERVQLCMRLMRGLKWVRGKTDKFLAKHWGVTETSVHSYSAEAWRRIKTELTDPDATAATVCVALERVVRENAPRGLAGARYVIDASKTWAAIAGAGAPTRVEIGALATMSDAELDARRREIILRLQEGEPSVPLEEEGPPEESDHAALPREIEESPS